MNTTKQQLKELTVSVIQHRCSNDPATNLDTSEHRIRDAALMGARLVLLQELHTSIYFCQTENPAYFDLAEPVPGPTSKRLGALAKELKIVIVGSVFEHSTEGIYHNTAIVLDSDGILTGSYRKMHIPDDPGYYEKFYFTPGDQGFHPINTTVGRLGVLVCWDQWYPEAARLMALHGADLLLYPSAIGWDTRDSKAEQQKQRESWQIVQRGHAIANNLPLLCSNRVGLEPDPSGKTDGIRFWGSSFIAGPQGEIIKQAGDAREAVLVTRVNFQQTGSIRRIWPFFRDRRIDAYGDLVKHYNDC